MRDHGKLKKLKKVKLQRGRPTKLTPELVTTLINALQRSAYVETAIAYAGINKDTYYEWVREGARASERENKGEILDDHDRALADFSDSVKKSARARGIEKPRDHPTGRQNQLDGSGMDARAALSGAVFPEGPDVLGKPGWLGAGCAIDGGHRKDIWTGV
jgi:hypothetical protein